jgi:hypothetical protein
MFYPDRQVKTLRKKIRMTADGENLNGKPRIGDHVLRENRNEDGLSQIEWHTHSDVS